MTLGRGQLNHLGSWLSSWELGVALEWDGGVPWLGPSRGAKFRNHQVGAIEAEPNWKVIGGRGWVPLKRPRQAGRDEPTSPRQQTGQAEVCAQVRPQSLVWEGPQQCPASFNSQRRLHGGDSREMVCGCAFPFSASGETFVQ